MGRGKRISWGVTTNVWGYDLPYFAQNSIFDDNVGAADTLKERPESFYRKNTEAGPYGTALGVLHSRGWEPTVTFDKTVHPRTEKDIA